MPTRKEMIAALQKELVPILRQRHFTGSFPHFRRIGRDQVDLLTFQFDNWGGGFVVEIGKCGCDGFTTSWGEKIPARKVTAHDIHPSNRLRLGAGRPGEDNWFRYDEGSTVEAVARQVVPHLDEAEMWWKTV